MICPEIQGYHSGGKHVRYLDVGPELDIEMGKALVTEYRGFVLFRTV